MSIHSLEPVDIPGHVPSGIGHDDHPMRIMTRRIAGLASPPWDDEARTAVAGFFDTLATEWHTRSSPERLAVVTDALVRGLDPMLDGHVTALEIGAGTGFYSAMLADRFDVTVAVELSFEMSRRAPADPAHRLLADAAVLPVADGTVDALVLVNSFLFPAEVARVLRVGGLVVWVNSSGTQTPIHLRTDEVVDALGFEVEGVESGAGAGTWAVFRRLG